MTLEEAKRWIYERSTASPPIRNIVQKSLFSDAWMMATLATGRIGRIDRNLGTLPPKLILESTNICNAACVMCLYPSMSRRKGVMSFELFQKIVDEYSTSAKMTRLQMNHIGEPFLDPLLLKKIGYAKEEGIDFVFCYSNGSRLDTKTSEKLIDSGLDQLFISFDGTSKASYEKVRRNLVFEDVLNNVKQLAQLKAEKKATKPQVELHITVSSANKSEEQHFAKKMGQIADTVSITHAHDWAGQYKSDNDTGQESKRVQQVPCANLWAELPILWDGRAALCCLDYEGKVVLGDANETSIRNIWNGNKAKAVRASHLKRKFHTALCKQCTEHTWVHWWQNYWD